MYGVVFLSSSILSSYILHKRQQNPPPSPPVLKTYKATIYKEEYIIDRTLPRKYGYIIPCATFTDFEYHYKKDLMGCGIVKKQIDDVFRDYLKTNVITQKRVVVLTDEFIGDFEIFQNEKNETLVLDININPPHFE
jgi:hypothetical protein